MKYRRIWTWGSGRRLEAEHIRSRNTQDLFGMSHEPGTVLLPENTKYGTTPVYAAST